jgi:hypothetical protein
VSDNGAVSAPEDYVHGLTTKIPPSHRDELIRRRRRGESLKSIAAEYDCHKNTVSRAIMARLIELDEYHPAEFHAAQRARRREAWEWMKEVWQGRDARIREAAQAAEEQQARLEASDREERRLRARLFRERQRAKALAEQGLPY